MAEIFQFFTAIFLLNFGKVSALECQQIPAANFYDGSDFFWPANATGYVTIPPNFDCTYTISANITNSSLLFGRVELTNLLKSVNDHITITDSFGAKTILGSRSDSYLIYDVFPGKPMTIQVTTRSVNMNSQFLIHVSYEKVKMAAPRQLKMGGVMNYVDMSDLRADTQGYSDALEVSADEQMSLSLAVYNAEYPDSYLRSTYVIDGDFYNQLAIYHLIDFLHLPKVTISKKITFVSFQQIAYYDTAVVINRLSEARQFGSLSAMASPGGELEKIQFVGDIVKDALQILAVEANQITMDNLVFSDTPIPPNCIAQVVTGPPNNSSQLILDLTMAANLMPYTFNLKYFSIIFANCNFSLSVSSPIVQ